MPGVGPGSHPKIGAAVVPVVPPVPTVPGRVPTSVDDGVGIAEVRPGRTGSDQQIVQREATVEKLAQKRVAVSGF